MVSLTVAQIAGVWFGDGLLAGVLLAVAVLFPERRRPPRPAVHRSVPVRAGTMRRRPVFDAGAYTAEQAGTEVPDVETTLVDHPDLGPGWQAGTTPGSTW